jgi:hypothetical protein
VLTEADVLTGPREEENKKKKKTYGYSYSLVIE